MKRESEAREREVSLHRGSDMTPQIRSFEKLTVNSTLTASSARQAAMLASNIAGLAMQWSELRNAGATAASEAVQAAEYAWSLAESAACATSEDEVRLFAADAWSAAQRAIAADQRVTVAVAATGY